MLKLQFLIMKELEMAEKWTAKELNKFKTMIEGKRESVVAELEEARERAEGFSTGDSVNAIYSSHSLFSPAFALNIFCNSGL